MRNLATPLLLVAACALMGVGVAEADSKSRNAKPESIVLCALAEKDYLVGGRSAPASFNLEQCVTWPGPISKCSDCIRSLENQGCNMVDVIVETTALLPEGIEHSATYLLSCERP